jgi:hypothetical protein
MIALALCLVACQPQQREETILFQEAETLYQDGDYEGATTRYEAFLEAYPRSPFAATARRRLKTIDREVDSVISVRGGNRPIYIRPEASPDAGRAP